MTRKDYIALARMIAKVNGDVDRIALTEDMVDYLRATNNLFDPQRFRNTIHQARLERDEER